MKDLELLHFEQLKNEVQAQYLKNHTPSNEEISKWKGIDIIYFQEDLRKYAKGNISEKTFYTYFKTSPVLKLPRIDMLNILSVYAGYASWYDFKKNHLFADEILKEYENNHVEKPTAAAHDDQNDAEQIINVVEKPITENKNIEEIDTKNSVLQKSSTENQEFNINTESHKGPQNNNTDRTSFIKKYLWLGISAVLFILVTLLGFKDEIFSKEYTYRFIDADRNALINDDLEVKILNENGESPILFKLKPGKEFTYRTKNISLKMVVNSTFYKEATINRNLENAPQDETIELQPNDFAQMLYFYTKNIKDLKRKRDQLNRLISDGATIYQVFDNDTYGVETMDKQRYISLVTLPTTSLENLQVIETKNNTNGKIIMIKFRIGNDDNK